MPKIKAYAGKGSLIPVDTAVTVTAYECPWTGKMYRRKDAYIRHLAELREYTFHPRIRARNAKKIFNELWQLGSFEEIIKWMSDHSLFIFEQTTSRHYMKEDELKDAAKNFKFEITYLNLNWSESVSNSHSCPRNGVQNWRGDEKMSDGTPKPRGYPGWHGRIEFRKSHDLSFASSMLDKFGIHTGTGGGNGIASPAGYEVRFFDADWPGLAAKTQKEFEAYESNKVFERLKDNFLPNFAPTYRYGESTYFRR